MLSFLLFFLHILNKIGIFVYAKALAYRTRLTCPGYSGHVPAQIY